MNYLEELEDEYQKFHHLFFTSEDKQEKQKYFEDMLEKAKEYIKLAREAT